MLLLMKGCLFQSSFISTSGVVSVLPLLFVLPNAQQVTTTMAVGAEAVVVEVAAACSPITRVAAVAAVVAAVALEPAVDPEWATDGIRSRYVCFRRTLLCPLCSSFVCTVRPRISAHIRF